MANSEIDSYTHKLYSEHGEDRIAAIGWFCANPKEARPVLRAFFEPLEEEWAALAAIEALGCIANSDDVPLLDSVLASGRLSFNAGIALAKNPSAAAFAALLQRSDDESEAVARGAISGLGERGDEAARPKLENLLRHENSNIRWATVLAIEDLGAKVSEQALLDCLKIEKDRDVKSKIREILK